MYQITRKERLNPTVTLMEVSAPLIAKKAEPGQFIILRVDDVGERIPLTIADFDRVKGTVTIIFQIVGATTEKLNHLEEGEYIHDFVGPLGKATHTEGLKKVAVVGGGVGCAIAFPVAKKLFNLGCEGVMSMGAFICMLIPFMVGGASKVAWYVNLLGLAAAALVGALLGLLFGVVVIKFSAPQGIAGIGLQLFGTGLAGTLYRHFIGGAQGGA